MTRAVARNLSLLKLDSRHLIVTKPDTAAFSETDNLPMKN